MAPRATRSKGPAAATANAPATVSKHTLPPESANPPHVFILPKKAAPDARIVTLPHPRYKAKPTRYLVCPETGVYEFTQIACPKTTPRSWLIARGGGVVKKGDKVEKEEKKGEQTTEEETAPSDAPSDDAAFEPQTSKSPDLYVASPFDPLFLLLPALASAPASSSSSSSAKRLFLTIDDHLDALPQEHSHLAELVHPPDQPINKLFAARMAAVCDTVEAGDESMFRLNEDKLLLELLAKAQRVSSAGLPASMEDKFVTKALEAPVMSVKSRGPTAPTAAAASPGTGGSTTPRTDASESQSTVSSTADAGSSVVSEASTAATSVDANSDDSVVAAMQAPDEVVALQRLRVAFCFVCSRYVPAEVAARLEAKLGDKAAGICFAPLDAYLASLAAMRQQVLAARSAALDYASSRKRTLEEEDDDRAEKRRKREEEEKRKKAGESRGVKNLKKVNTTGMKKLSEFFKKK